MNEGNFLSIKNFVANQAFLSCIKNFFVHEELASLWIKHFVVLLNVAWQVHLLPPNLEDFGFSIVNDVYLLWCVPISCTCIVAPRLTRIMGGGVRKVGGFHLHV